MANLGYVSTFNINGNELTLKDAALTEIVNEIIEAIGANNTNIAERINDLHNRSFDNTIKISSQNESEIASIQDGMYKLQYVTVTGEGDNATETLNNSAILIQKGTNQYLYKDGIISSRTKTDSTWGSWITFEGGVTSVNGATGAVITQLSDDYVPSELVNEYLELSAGDTYEEAFGKLHKAILDNEEITAGALADLDERIDDLADVASSGDYYDLLNLPTIPTSTSDLTNDSGFITQAPVTSVNGQTGAVSLSIPDAQIQADWNQTTTTAKDYIKNKPTIPTVPTTSTTVTANDTNPVSGGAVYAKLEDLIGSAPAALDTLGEIATALNNDANLAGTLTNQIAGKISKVSPATAGNFVSLNSDGTLIDSGHKHSDYLTSETQADWNETNTSSAAYINNKPTIKDELSSNYATSTDTNDDLLLTSGDTYEEAFGKLEKAILDNSEVAATAIQEVASNSATAIQEVASNMVTSVNGQTGDVTITIPEGQLSNDYAISTATNEDLELASGDTYETAFGKLEKAIIDNELVVTAAITDLDSRVTDTESLATVAKSGSYNDLTNRPTIPTKTSDLTNDSGFLTSAPVTSVNGQQGAVTLTLGQTNVIETVKVNNTALTPDANKAVNIDLSEYDKAPLIIEINNTDTTVPSGTFASITTALAAGRKVVVKVINDTGDGDYQYYYITNDHAIVGDGFYEFSSPAKAFYLFRLQIYDDDTFGIYGDDDSDMFITRGDAQSITGYKDFTVSPTVPTAASSSNDTTAASTAFVKTALNNQTHGNITNDGKLQTSDISIANGDKLVITDSSNSSKIARASLSFDGSTTTKALTPKGTWEPFLKTAPVQSVNGQTGAVTVKANVQSDWNATTGDAVILNKPTIPAAVTESTVAGWGFTKNTGTLTTETQLSKGTATGTGNAVTDINVSNHQITLVKGATYATQEDINESISNLVNSAPTTLDTLNELATALGNDPNFATTVATQIGQKYTKPSTGIPASDLAAGVIPTVPVQSVNGMTGAVNINVGVTSFNGSTGAVTYTAPVTSVNGATGAVTVKANVQSDWNATTGDAVILNKPTIPTVNDSTVTLTMNGNTVGTFTLNKSGNTTIDLGTVLTSHQSIKTINNQTITGTGNVNISGLPTVTSADNGKVLMVVNGEWTLVNPVSLYSGSGTPDNSQGNNGDIYVQS